MPDVVKDRRTPGMETSNQPRSARRAAAASALITAIAAVVAAVVIAFVGCGGGDSNTAATPSAAQIEEQIKQARREGREQAEHDLRVRKLQREVEQLKRQQRKQRRNNSGSEPSSSSPRPAPSPGFTACDSNISVSGASCEFANTTFWTYWTSGQPRSISVYDAASGNYFASDCVYAGQIECRTSRGVIVRFPQAAVDLYTQQDADRYAATHDVG